MANILDIVPYKFLPAKNGGQKAILTFCNSLAVENKLSVVATVNNDQETTLPFTLLPVFSSSRLRYFNPSYFFKIRKIIKEKKIAHFTTQHPYMAWLAFLIRRSTGAKWYIRSHNIEYMRFRDLNKWWWPLLKSYESWAYAKADKTLFIAAEDAAFAVNSLGINPARVETVPFGVEVNEPPPGVDEARVQVLASYGLPPSTALLLFNGDLAYKPNYDAVDFIVNEINPVLLKTGESNYRIIICGGGLPERFNNLADHLSKNIIYAGFVPDIDTYFKAAHVFLNPVVTGGGVKTKLVEAIAYNSTVISSVSGAIGVPPGICGNKLIIVPDNDAPAFAKAIPLAIATQTTTPAQFYNYFSFKSIATRLRPFFTTK